MISALESRGHFIAQSAAGLFGNAGIIIVHQEDAVEVGVDRRNGTSAGVVIPPDGP